MADNQLIELTADIVSAHVAKNNVAAADVPALIQSVFAALSEASEPSVTETPKQEPAVSIRASIKQDHIVCLEDGKKLKMLKRYLRTNYGMTPEDYRTKWNLPRDYPMVAPAYAETRRGLAHKIGLGRTPKAATSTLDESVKRSRGSAKAASDTPSSAEPSVA